MTETDRRALLGLLLTPGLGPTLVGRCVEALGSAAAAAEASPELLAAVQGISPRKARAVRAAMDKLQRDGTIDAELERVERLGVRLVAHDDPDYPPLLGHIPDPPPLLWVRGSIEEADALAVGVVGSRRCSHYGREQAERFGGGCARAGLCVVSGGAYGIDAAAHRGAIKAGGRTLAVIGSGLAEPYPKDHAKLFDRIVGDGHGAIISELPMTVAPKPENFPRRNRIISGLSLGVLVIEAALRSGALITARLCVEEHNRELMAVPGRVDSATSAGCHKVLREGWATLVTGPEDVLHCLGEAGRMLEVAQENRLSIGGGRFREEKASPSLFTVNLTDTQRKLWDALDAPRSLDQLCAWTQLPVQTIQSDLTMLEVRGAVKREGGLFRRNG